MPLMTSFQNAWLKMAAGFRNEFLCCLRPLTGGHKPQENSFDGGSWSTSLTDTGLKLKKERIKKTKQEKGYFPLCSFVRLYLSNDIRKIIFTVT